jgi:radical SAM superfamily enzyme YgiQ (UPF0313 family)
VPAGLFRALMSRNSFPPAAYDMVLINPPIHSGEVFIPKGIGYLRRILEIQGYRVMLIDLEAELHQGILSTGPEFIKQASERFRQNPARIFGFSVWNVSYPWVAPLAAALKEMYPQCRMVVGGPLATIFKERILEDNRLIDVVSIREGEKIIVPLVRALLSEDEGALGAVGNIVYRDKDNIIHHNPELPLLDDLDALPFLEFDEPYYYRNQIFNLEVGRGCAYRCTFCCAANIWPGKPRFLSAERIASRAQYSWDRMKAEGVEDPIIHLEHDNFLSDKELVKQILRIKKEKKYRFHYGFSGRIDRLDEDLIHLMAQSDCRYLYVGLESGSARIQKLINKRIDLETVLPKIRKVRALGIQVMANFILGFPQETMADLVLTLELMAHLSWLGVVLGANLLHPEPFTPIAALLQPADYVLIKTSSFYRELKNSGIEPESLPREMVSHLYAVNNASFDINVTDRFMAFYLALLRIFPLSSRFLLEVEEVPTAALYDRFQAEAAGSSADSSSPRFVYAFMEELIRLQDSPRSPAMAEILHYEAFRCQRSTGLRLTEKRYDEREFDRFYRRLADNPRLLRKNDIDR